MKQVINYDSCGRGGYPNINQDLVDKIGLSILEIEARCWQEDDRAKLQMISDKLHEITA